MESGELVILEETSESVFESLYDVLNQKYSVINSQRFSRVNINYQYYYLFLCFFFENLDCFGKLF